MEPLEKKYLGALEDLQRGYAQSGNLSAAVIVKDEIERAQGGGEKEDSVSEIPLELARLQTSYEKAIERSAGPVIARYKKGLAQLQERLTAENNVESAVRIRDRLVEMDRASIVDIVSAATDGGSFQETASLEEWLQTKELHWRGNTANVVIQFNGNDAHVIANGNEIMKKRFDVKDGDTFTFDWSADDLNTFTISKNRREFTRHMEKTDSGMQGQIRNR